MKRVTSIKEIKIFCEISLIKLFVLAGVVRTFSQRAFHALVGFVTSWNFFRGFPHHRQLLQYNCSSFHSVACHNCHVAARRIIACSTAISGMDRGKLVSRCLVLQNLSSRAKYQKRSVLTSLLINMDRRKKYETQGFYLLRHNVM